MLPGRTNAAMSKWAGSLLSVEKPTSIPLTMKSFGDKHVGASPTRSAMSFDRNLSDDPARVLSLKTIRFALEHTCWSAPIVYSFFKTMDKRLVFLACPGLGRINRGYETWANGCFQTLRDEPSLDLCLFKGGGPSSQKEITVLNLPRSTSLAEFRAKLPRLRVIVLYSACYPQGWTNEPPQTPLGTPTSSQRFTDEPTCPKFPGLYRRAS